jgi:hypothetical protein
MKKFQLRKLNKFLVLFGFVLKTYSQNDECTKIYYANDKTSIIKDLESEYIRVKDKDSIIFKNNQNINISFFKDKIFINKKKIYQYENVEYYNYIVYLKKDNKEYVYIYPHYRNRTGPYIWYELGILIELYKDETIIKGNLDYFEDFDICDVLEFKNYTIIKKIKNIRIQ